MISCLLPWAKRDLHLTLLHSERPKLHRVLAVLSAIGLMVTALQLLAFFPNIINISFTDNIVNYEHLGPIRTLEFMSYPKQCNNEQCNNGVYSFN